MWAPAPAQAFRWGSQSLLRALHAPTPTRVRESSSGWWGHPRPLRGRRSLERRGRKGKAQKSLLDVVLGRLPSLLLDKRTSTLLHSGTARATPPCRGQGSLTAQAPPPPPQTWTRHRRSECGPWLRVWEGQPRQVQCREVATNMPFSGAMALAGLAKWSGLHSK